LQAEHIPHCTSWDKVWWYLGHHSLSAPRTKYWS